jgi:hypothetical protein
MTVRVPAPPGEERTGADASPADEPAPADTGPDSPFTVTVDVARGRCTAALTAAADGAPPFLQTELAPYLTGTGFRSTTEVADHDAAEQLRRRACDCRRDGLDKAAERCTLAAASIDTVHDTCPCPSHTWARSAEHVDTLLTRLGPRVWAVRYGADLLADQHGVQSHRIIFIGIGQWNALTRLTVTWQPPVLTFDRHGAAPPLILQALDPAQHHAWLQWRSRDPRSPGSSRAASVIITIPDDVLADIPTVYDALTRTGRLPYAQVATTVRDLRTRPGRRSSAHPARTTRATAGAGADR